MDYRLRGRLIRLGWCSVATVVNDVIVDVVVRYYIGDYLGLRLLLLLLLGLRALASLINDFSVFCDVFNLKIALVLFLLDFGCFNR